MYSVTHSCFSCIFLFFCRYFWFYLDVQTLIQLRYFHQFVYCLQPCYWLLFIRVSCFLCFVIKSVKAFTLAKILSFFSTPCNPLLYLRAGLLYASTITPLDYPSLVTQFFHVFSLSVTSSILLSWNWCSVFQWRLIFISDLFCALYFTGF